MTLYPFILVCHLLLGDCYGIVDQEAPYDSPAECTAQLPGALLFFGDRIVAGEVPGPAEVWTVRKACCSLTEPNPDTPDSIHCLGEGQES